MRKQGDKETWRQGDEGACRLVLLLFLTLSFLAYPSQASDISPQKSGEIKRTPEITSKAKLSFGYDNNVCEQKENKTESRFFRLYVSSDMYMFPAKQTLLSLKVQNGLKYLDASALSGESVLINGLTLCLSHRISERLIPEIHSEIRGRTSIHSKGEVLPSEEAYLRGSVGAALRAIALSDVNLRAFYRYGFTNFEDFDPFDRRESRIGLKADVRLLPELTASLQCSRTKMRFNKWDLAYPDAAVFRADTVSDISFSAQMYCFFLFDVTYSHQNSKSDTDGYSYRANKLALLMAKYLPQNVMFQLCAFVRSKKYRPAFVFVHEADAVEYGGHAAILLFPGFTFVGGMENNAVISHNPAVPTDGIEAHLLKICLNSGCLNRYVPVCGKLVFCTRTWTRRA